MSGPRREELVSLAREHDACIICDDVYDHLQWSGRSNDISNTSMQHATLPRLVDVDRFMAGGPEREGADGFGNVVSNGTFSKIVGPGCRTGWAEGTPKFAYGLSQVGSSRSGGAPSQLTATFISKLLESRDLQHHIFDTLQPKYRRRYRELVEAIEKYLIPHGVELMLQYRDIAGGYFLWISLPSPLIAEELAAVAKAEEKVIVAPGPLCAVKGDEEAVNLDRNIRLCFAWEEECNLEEGVLRLGHVIERMKLRAE